MPDSRFVAGGSCEEGAREKAEQWLSAGGKTQFPTAGAETKAEAAEDGGNGLAASIAKSVFPYLETRLKAKVDALEVEAIVSRKMEAEGVRRVVVDLTRRDASKEARDVGECHVQFAELLYVVSEGHHAYLYGAPGGGKSYAAKQAAAALARRFGYISLNPQTPVSLLVGYKDAGGTYRDTLFHELYSGGGVFCIDEMDNASASLLTTLNSALENGAAAFPCGMVERHPDFVVVATGNTCGRGANPQFPERRPFDAAVSERFTYLQWHYDEKLERRLARAINPDAAKWVKWVQAVREYCAARHTHVVVSPRASYKGAAYLARSGWDAARIAESVLWKGLDKATVAAIVAAVPYPA